MNLSLFQIKRLEFHTILSPASTGWDALHLILALAYNMILQVTCASVSLTLKQC